MDFNPQRKFRSLFADFKRIKITENFFLLHSKRVNRHSEFHWVKGVSIATKMAAKQWWCISEEWYCLTRTMVITTHLEKNATEIYKKNYSPYWILNCSPAKIFFTNLCNFNKMMKTKTSLSERNLQKWNKSIIVKYLNSAFNKGTLRGKSRIFL